MNLLFKILVWVLRLQNSALRRLLWPGISAFFRNAFWKAKLKALGDGVFIHPNVVVHQPNKVSIGDRCSIAEFVHIWGGGDVEIGADVLVASHAAIVSVSHDPSAQKFNETRVAKPISIDDNVWIGAGAVLLPGIKLGTGSIVAAGAVVTKDVPRDVVVAGVPARVIKKRQP